RLPTRARGFATRFAPTPWAGDCAAMCCINACGCGSPRAYSVSHYLSFGQKVEALKTELVRLLIDLKTDGKHLAAYGAPAKGNTLLNYCGIGLELLEFTVDRNPHKQGMLLPGSHLPILPPAAL